MTKQTKFDQKKGISVKSLMKEGSHLRRTGKIEQAIAFYEKVIELDPNFPEVYYKLGNIFVRLKRLDEAFDAYNRAIQLRSDVPDYNCGLGSVLAKQGRLDEAIAHLIKAVESSPSFYQFQSKLAHTYFLQKNFSKAIYHYQKALDLKPYSSKDSFYLAECLNKKKEFRKALILYQKAFQLSPRFKKSFGLNRLDIKLAEYLDFDNGFFIEAGANNGVSQSNTVYLEIYQNWTGLLVEPIPKLAKSCRHNRPDCIVENYALVPFDYDQVEIEIYYCNLMSIVKNAVLTQEEVDKHIERGAKLQNIKSYELKVPAINLNSLLEKHKIKRIDLLSLDVEGFELPVLKGIDFNQYRPRFLLIEVRNNQEQELNDFCKQHSYKKLVKLSETEYYKDILYESQIEDNT